MLKIALIVCVFNFSFPLWALGNFFSISKKIKFVSKPKRGKFAIYKEKRNFQNKKIKGEFLPFIEIRVNVAEQIYSKSLFAKVYFFSKNNKMVATLDKPYPIKRKHNLKASMPTIIPKGHKGAMLYFVVPKKILKLKKWKALIVFGDKYSVAASVYPRRLSYSAKDFDFPEYAIFREPIPFKRPKARDPLLEYVYHTEIPAQPKITFFLRKPIGIEKMSQAKGVLALCLLAGSVGNLRKQLQEAEFNNELSGVLGFAEKHKLVVLCWGSRSLWNPGANWDDLDRKVYKKMNKRLDAMAKAWSRGVYKIAARYGIPRKNFLLCGFSGSAQYAARLVLRKPEFFLAVHLHIPSSFDVPLIKANKVLWCLTTGEKEVGYFRSLRFLEVAQKRGYPIIYKAIPNLGHAWHPLAREIGIEFLEYALSVRREKVKMELKSRKSSWKKQTKNYQPWPESLKNPKFVADVFRQKVYPVDKVPDELGTRIPIPTERLAKIWEGKH